MASPPHRLPIGSADDAAALFAGIATARTEIAAAAYLCPKWRLLGLRHTGGDIGSVNAAIRSIVRDALALECSTVLLAHNHPSGDCTPSADDLAFTRALAKVLAALGISLADHLILTADRLSTMRGAGFL